MLVDILTIFPQIFPPYLETGMLKQALDSGILQVNIHNLRDYTEDRHKQVDDYPFGGKRGMILMPEPIVKGVEDLKQKSPLPSKVILLSPQGRAFDQAKAEDLASLPHLIFICGRYEGVDERVRSLVVDEEISIGDYILTGGELPALVITDAVTRLLPGVLDQEVTQEESFSRGLLDYPQYTRPREFRGHQVPEVLLSGNHQAIEEFRRKESIKRTFFSRPELLDKADLNKQEQAYLKKLARERG